MTRRATTWEFDAAGQIKDQAAEEVGILFPEAEIKLMVGTLADKPQVQAVVGNTAPHPREDIIGWLSELGVRVLEPEISQIPEILH